MNSPRMNTNERKWMRRGLLRWYRKTKRDLPWRRTSDPYRIWVSEVMLQQTRVAAVIPYYEKFLLAFPRVADLAEAPEEELLRMWAGLGYYSRARNLQKAARLIVERGSFPDSYEEIRELPGVGDYTAAAVASIAFDRPHAVLDGNVARVLARITGQAEAGREQLRLRAQDLLDRRHPGDFNQALMELGATICLPREPFCGECPWREACVGRREGREREIPAKSKKQRIEETRTLVLVRRKSALLLWRQPAEAKRMAGFWELPEAGRVGKVMLVAELGRFRHSITVHNYQFLVVEGQWLGRRLPHGYGWIQVTDLNKIPLSTVARKALSCAKTFLA